MSTSDKLTTKMKIKESEMKLYELTVLEDELKSLRKSSKVYRQQENSNLFFLDDQVHVKSETKRKMEMLKKEIELASQRDTGD
ncbi:hypothetical protein CHUAL_003070 [Chamberlinius hualienensis]